MLGLIVSAARQPPARLGCGWGGMMKYLHQKLGDSVTVEGITVSRTQAEFIKKSYGFNVEVGTL